LIIQRKNSRAGSRKESRETRTGALAAGHITPSEAAENGNRPWSS